MEARIPYRTIDANSSPNTTQVDSWIDHAEAMINGALRAGEITETVVTETHAVNILREIVVDYAEGRVRQAYAAAGGDGTNEDGEVQIERFDTTLRDIWSDSARWSAILNLGVSSSGAIKLRGTENTVIDGSNAPIFTKGGVNF